METSKSGVMRRKDTTKGPPLRILSLGEYKAVDLHSKGWANMAQTEAAVYVETEGKAPKRNQIPKPCDHFDLIIGTGTGGLIALMLGRLRLDLETCKEVYVRMTRKVFETDKTIAGIPYRSTLFKASKLEEAIKEENRTKTAVTAMYKGSAKGSPAAVLRSYDSRKEPSPEFDCKIWEAGRATSATGLAFKPIQIGQSVFIDEGAGHFNPTPVALDEACVNEWPGRDVGLVVSIGTGKRPSGSDQNSHLWYEGFLGDFAEARRRLIAKIEGCEETHQYMVREGLGKRGVNVENYYRLNVEIGVGEFGMNEWNRLADISTNTRRYLSKSHVQQMTGAAAVKMAKIHRAKARFENEGAASLTVGASGAGAAGVYKDLPDVPEAYPGAVEMLADIPIMPQRTPPLRPSYESGRNDALEVPNANTSTPPRVSQESYGRSHGSPKYHQSRLSQASIVSEPGDKFTVYSPTPGEYHNYSGNDKIAIMSADEAPKPPIISQLQQSGRVEPPPLPPKTPIPDAISSASRNRVSLPYPADDGPPPAVNMAKKPAYRG
ncbi:putative Calcium-independent phospholipase A2-gamma [Glarea lozoyensis 74030]|uniref:Putative Calcium-independent phospholipase A2-gamma n=1 Tax=Glarea lozoyensis (strain ATCC 74030 / MF5533) TaxID=1104152 RepID=H0EUD4_GLAL7|nr:putative Calcium-independent phospholipase A2-gamma [Glarea lozoyensis 74030]